MRRIEGVADVEARRGAIAPRRVGARPAFGAPPGAAIGAVIAAAIACLALLLAGCAPAPRQRPAPVETVRVPSPPAPGAAVELPTAEAARSWAQFRLQAARRIVAANPGGIFLGEPPEVLLAIPVLEIELNADGSIRRIEVMRMPRQATDTVELAIAAVRRAAPFGDVSRLPRPWRYSETFLFDDERRFKPRSLQ